MKAGLARRNLRICGICAFERLLPASELSTALGGRYTLTSLHSGSFEKDTFEDEKTLSNITA